MYNDFVLVQILLVNGANHDTISSVIYSLSKTDLSKWVNFGFTKSPRYAHVAFLVPDQGIMCEGDSLYTLYKEEQAMLKDDELIETLNLE